MPPKIPLRLYGINAKNIIQHLGWLWHFQKLFKADTSAFCTSYQSETVEGKSNHANYSNTAYKYLQLTALNVPFL